MSNFKTIVLVVFGIFIFISVAIFAGVGGFTKGDSKSTVVVWGTIEERTVMGMLNDKVFKSALSNVAFVKYIEKDSRTYESEFVNALASGAGPDLVLLPHDFIVEHQDKLIVVPFDSYGGERKYKNTFIEEGELFLTSDGILGLPFTIDPLVMYWNRNIFSGAGIANPPEYWDELFTLSPKMTNRDQSLNILQSTVALGEFINITNAKEILSALIMQAGNPIVVRDEGSRSGFSVHLGDSSTSLGSPAEAALRFYTEFSNPVKSVYSWNRALPEDRQSFIAGDLAIYFGFASELTELRRANPNLNFDVATLPQSRDAGFRRTFGNMSALAVSRNASNPSAAFGVANVFSGNRIVSLYTKFSPLPPVRRDLLAQTPPDAYSTVFYNSALIANAWLDLDREATTRVFKDMVEGVTSGRLRLNNAIRTAEDELENLLPPPESIQLNQI